MVQSLFIYSQLKFYTMKKSNYQFKLKANRKFKTDIFSLAGLQRYAIRVFEGKESNPDFLEFCKELDLTVNDMKFEHVIKYGRDKELNKIDRKTGKIIEKKQLFSFWLFITCLARYRAANQIHSDLSTKTVKNTVNIEEKSKKPAAKRTKKAA